MSAEARANSSDSYQFELSYCNFRQFFISVTVPVPPTVLNRDIGFVAKGQSVEIKLETFPFTKYGLIPGVVQEVWRDAIQDDKQGLVYKTEITLLAFKILIGDTWVLLTPGMATQAEIKTGDRRVIEYFLSPFLRYRAEALRER